MFCQNCGRYCPKKSSLCQHCGAELAKKSAKPESDHPDAHIPAAQPPSPEQADAVRNIIKSVGNSPLFLIAMILFAAVEIIVFINHLTESSLSLYYISQGMEMLYAEFVHIRAVTEIGMLVVILIPDLAILLGLILSYASAKKRTGPGISYAGLTIIDIITAIRLVILCVVAVLLLIFTVGVTFFNSGNSYISSDFFFIVALLFFLGIVAVIIVYLADIIRMIGSVKLAARTGIPSLKASKSVAALSTVIGTVIALMALFSFSDLLALLCGLFTGAYMIIFGILIAKYRRQILEVMSAPQS